MAVAHGMLTMLRSIGCALAIAALAAAGAPPASAQTAAPAQPAKPRDAQVMAAARDYVRATELVTGFARTLPQLSEQFVRQVRQKNPQATDDTMRAFSEALFDEFLLKRTAELETLVVEAVVDTFSREEIAALRTFFTSAIGRSITQKQPQLLQRVPAALQEWARRAGPESARAAADRVKAQGRGDLRL